MNKIKNLFALLVCLATLVCASNALALSPVVRVLPGTWQPNWPQGACAVWHRSDFGYNATTGVWNDQSGNGYATVGSGANYPTFVANALNGLPALHTDLSLGGSLTYSVNASTMMPGTAGERWLASENLGGATTQQNYEGFWGNENIGEFLPYSSGAIYDSFAQNATRPSFTPGNIEAPFVYGTSVTATTYSLYFNKYSSASASGSAAFAAKTSPPFLAGDNNHNTATAYWFEWIVFNRALTTAERTQLVQYLGARYGITVN